MISASAICNKSSWVLPFSFRPQASEASSSLILSLEDGLAVSFAQVKYEDVAPFVGLDPYRYLKDIGTFELHRSRIPTTLFKSIIQDMDMMMVQYGPLPEHEHQEATSRFLSPVRMIRSSDYDKPRLLPTDL
jgi:hypothetical protein